MELTDLKMRTFAFFSANLHQLLPHIPYEEHLTLYNQSTRFGRLALDESRSQRWLQEDFLPPEILRTLSRPGIIATFHTGPYRVLPMWLALKGRPVTVLVSGDVAENQGVQFDETYRYLCAQSALTAPYSCLVAEDPFVLRKMLRALDQGHYLVIYVDGHTGTGAVTKRKDTSVLDFLGRPLQIRTGVAELARISSAPIYPMMMKFDTVDKPTIIAGQPYGFQNTARQPEEIHSVMKMLYSGLEIFLEEHAMQWEGWYHIHHDLLMARHSPNGGILRHYMPFQLGNRYFLLHKDSLSSFSINAAVYHQVKKFLTI